MNLFMFGINWCNVFEESHKYYNNQLIKNYHFRKLKYFFESIIRIIRRRSWVEWPKLNCWRRRKAFRRIISSKNIHGMKIYRESYIINVSKNQHYCQKGNQISYQSWNYLLLRWLMFFIDHLIFPQRNHLNLQI